MLRICGGRLTPKVLYSHPRRGVNVRCYNILTPEREVDIWCFTLLNSRGEWIFDTILFSTPSKRVNIWCYNFLTSNKEVKMQCYNIFTICKWVKISFYNIITPRVNISQLYFHPWVVILWEWKLYLTLDQIFHDIMIFHLLFNILCELRLVHFRWHPPDASMLDARKGCFIGR